MSKTNSKIIKWIRQANSNERISKKLGRPLDEELNARIEKLREAN